MTVKLTRKTDHQVLCSRCMQNTATHLRKAKLGNGATALCPECANCATIPQRYKESLSETITQRGKQK